jgi:ABC-type multidrug transport system ATPase subunit
MAASGCFSVPEALNFASNMQISLQSVSKRYGKVCALDNVTLTLEPGQIVSVLGANGAGKTTLLRCLSGVVAREVEIS